MSGPIVQEQFVVGPRHYTARKTEGCWRVVETTWFYDRHGEQDFYEKTVEIPFDLTEAEIKEVARRMSDDAVARRKAGAK